MIKYKYRKNKAQAIIEYVAMIAIVAAAVIGFSVYFKRSMQGQYKNTADTYGGGFLYSPGETQINN